MRELPKGEVRKTRDGYSTRVRVTAKRRDTIALSTCRSDDEADRRSAVLADLARRFGRAGLYDTPDVKQLVDTAANGDEFLLPGVRTVAAQILGDELPSPESSGPTFQTVAEEWFDGTMRKSFPDNVERVSERYMSETKRRLVNGVFPVIGSKPIALVTRADCDNVMRQLPIPKGKDELSRETRRQYGVAISRVFGLAELAGYIERSPLPKGWLPRAGDGKRFPILYPSEDRTLLACSDVPLCVRILYGFLHREGMRRSEAATLQVRELDLEHGTVALDRNKTNHARFWRLSPGVAKVLRAWLKQRDAKPTDFVFVDEKSATLDLEQLTRRVHGDLERAGLDRADLTSVGKNKGRFGVHCFRRSFVTRNLALGKNEDFVRQRTGHKSDELLTYRQGAKALAELELGDVLPLDQAIPEFRSTPKAGDPSPRRGWRKRASKGQSLPPYCPQNGRGGRIRTGDHQTPSRRDNHDPAGKTLDRESRIDEESRLETEKGQCAGQYGDARADHDRSLFFELRARASEIAADLPADAVEQALLDALERARGSGAVADATALRDALEARQRARAALPSLAAERAKRGAR